MNNTTLASITSKRRIIALLDAALEQQEIILALLDANDDYLAKTYGCAESKIANH